MTIEELSVVFSADIAPFSNAVSQLTALLPGAAAAADEMVSGFENAGVQAALGLRNGLLSGKTAVAAAAQAVAAAAAAALRNALQIHSPSKLTYEAGAFFDEGLLRGILGGVAGVENAAENLGLDAVNALKKPELLASSPMAGAVSQRENNDPLSGLSITIPLEIDGYRLGVAAIEGINRVTQSTGRVELQL